MTSQSLTVGKKGEDIALKYLLGNKYSLIDRNYRSKYGEIDVIVKKNNTYFFVEVKTRIGIAKGKPYEAVHAVKLRHLKIASDLYVLKNNLKKYKLSLMVISVILTNDLRVDSIKEYLIEDRLL